MSERVGGCLHPFAGMRALFSLLLSVVCLMFVATPAMGAEPKLDLSFTTADSVEAGVTVPVTISTLNEGDAPYSGSVTFELTVAPEISVSTSHAPFTLSPSATPVAPPQECQHTTSTMVCTVTLLDMKPGVRLSVGVYVVVDPAASGELPVQFRMSGTGLQTRTIDHTMTVGLQPWGIKEWRGRLSEADDSPTGKGGWTPHRFVTELFPTTASIRMIGGFFPTLAPREQLKDAAVHLPLGLTGNPEAVPACSLAQLSEFGTKFAELPACPPESQIGVYRGTIFGGTEVLWPVYNIEAPYGSVASIGFNASGVPIVLDAKLNPDDYGVDVVSRNINTTLVIASVRFDIWGAPGDASHDGVRGRCLNSDTGGTGESCPVEDQRARLLRTPTRCSDGIEPVQIKLDSYQHPGVMHQASFGLPAMNDCARIPFQPTLDLQPTALHAESPSGLRVKVDVDNPGFEDADALADSDIKTGRVILPRGITINPSQAEGLGVCRTAAYESTSLAGFGGAAKGGCPSNAKIGTVEVKTPLLEEGIPGTVYVAEPYKNPVGSLLAIYIVLEEPQRGILVKLVGKIETDAQTGRIVATFDDLPQQPMSSFEFKFREGARAPLVTPPTCGKFETIAEFVPWADPSQVVVSKSSFQVTAGIGGGPCPAGGTPGFKPGFTAGSVNNNAGSYSPFVMRLTRLDGEQDMTRFSAVLPPGVLGKLAGIDKCPSSAIAIAKAKSGLQERANPSCPANSEIGRSIVGAGVGSVLTYVPGKVYLGGPFNGRPLSVIAITPAVAGPFDVGTVVVQEALTLNPKTAEVEVDGSASDPIPHMLKGIPAKLRDLRVYVDRDKFIINPTSCDPSATSAELFGGGGNAFTTADDVPILLSDRFQAASCSALGFKPKLGLKLKGGTRRGNFPGLQATYRPRPGDANVEGLVVRLPRSAFLEQGHIRTICTRVQFAADACPKASQYGYIKAWTPLLDEPLQGPVWLRSSNHKLPDLVFDLHGLVDVEVATRIDSIRGGVRASVGSIPDAPLSKVVLRMQGGKKGLIVNSRNLCSSTNKANVESDGHNGKVRDFNPVMKPQCTEKRKKRR